MLNKDGVTTDFAKMPIAEVIEGNALDSHYTLLLFEKLILDLPDLFKEFNEAIIAPMNAYFANQTRLGIPINLLQANILQDEVEEKLQELEKELKSLVGNDDFNIRSANDLAEIVYEKFSLLPPEKTEKGKNSTSKDSFSFLLAHIRHELKSRGINVT